MTIFDLQKVLPDNDMERWSLRVGGQERAATEVHRELMGDGPGSKS